MRWRKYVNWLSGSLLLLSGITVMVMDWQEDPIRPTSLGNILAMLGIGISVTFIGLDAMLFPESFLDGLKRRLHWYPPTWNILLFGGFLVLAGGTFLVFGILTALYALGILVL